MKELRAVCPRPPTDCSVPPEIIYADDADTISKCAEVIATTEEKAAPVLGNWDLRINGDKTDRTTLKRRTNQEQETWRNTKKLGTLLGDTQEMHRRKQLASVAFNNLKVIWATKKHNRIREALRLRLYNAYVLPVLTYNACTWTLTASEQDELDAFHRKQLRRVIGISYPRKISNEALYKRCNTQKLRHTIRGARWRMFGHVLRMDEQVPAKQAMQHFFDERSEIYKGRPRTTLQVVLDKDLEVAADNIQANLNSTASAKQVPPYDIPKRIHDLGDLGKLEQIAMNRSTWRKSVVEYMQVSPPRKQPLQRPRRHE